MANFRLIPLSELEDILGEQTRALADVVQGSSAFVVLREDEEDQPTEGTGCEDQAIEIIDVQFGTTPHFEERFVGIGILWLIQKMN